MFLQNPEIAPGKTGIVLIFTMLLSLNYACKNIPVAKNLEVNDLRCEMLTNPLGIDITQPKLSWKIQSNERNILQTAYQIIVASTPDLLDNNIGDLWNSGKVNSSQSVHVVYLGSKLKSRMHCYWKVKIWSNQSESSWSEPAEWSMGLLNYKDWSGRWIGFDRAFTWDKIEMHSRLSARYFRKEFSTNSGKAVKKATVYIIGLGLYELYMNGEKIGNQVLSPTPTDFSKNVKYNTFDVTKQIRNGSNAIGTILGNGRFFTMRQNYKPYKIKNFGFPKMLLNLVIEYTDSTIQVIRTDNSWKGTPDGPIRSNNEYDGEDYDARKEMPGWNLPGFDDKNWLQAEYVQEPGGEYEAQLNPNMKVMKEIKPVSVKKITENRYIIDFGQNFAGWIRITTEGRQGERITIRYAESLDENGELFTAPLRDAKVTDHYILKGAGKETWQPSFVYHGFRFAEVSGMPGKPSIDNFTGCVVYDELQTTGEFNTSDTLLNQIYHNAFWSVISTYKGMPIDCPQRNERMPWLGDRAIGCYGESYIVYNCKLYEKWLDDIFHAQKADGCLSDVAPPYFMYYSDNMTWPGTSLFVANMLYKQYGLIDPIIKHYRSMKLWLNYMKDRYLVDYIMTKDSYGDWCAPPKTIEEGRGKSADVKHPSALISTAYFYKYLLMMQEFARIADHNQDISGYGMLADSVLQAFNKVYFNPQQGYYGDKKLTENLLPLSFGMVPVELKESLLQNISDIILNENNGHLSSGLVGVQWLMRSLSENGMPDIAWKLATNTTYPGWGYMVHNGATTIWELWNANTAAPNMNSQNHVMMLGDLIIWFYEHLAGIKSTTEQPGFKQIQMNPDFPEQLTFVQASYMSVYGKITSNWSRNKNSIDWTISIPPNTQAKVYFPVSDASYVTEGGNSLNKTNGITNIKTTEKVAVLLESGTYNFKINI